jgi:hypothetical protein
MDDRRSRFQKIQRVKEGFRLELVTNFGVDHVQRRRGRRDWSLVSARAMIGIEPFFNSSVAFMTKGPRFSAMETRFSRRFVKTVIQVAGSLDAAVFGFMETQTIVMGTEDFLGFFSFTLAVGVLELGFGADPMLMTISTLSVVRC